jgi:tetratricopeptide (TPR) repeat protein
MNQADSALLYHNQGLRIAKEIENPKRVADAQYAIASILTKQNKYSQALPKAQEALQIRKELGELKEQSSTQALLATIHAALANYKAAYAAQSEYHALKDSLFNADNAKRLSALQANYDAQKQAAEQKFREAEARHKAELATQEKERQTQLQYAAIAGVVLFVLALALASRRVSTESSWGRRFGRLILSLAFSSCFFLTESYGNAVNRYRVFRGNKECDDSTKTVQNKLGIVQTIMTQPPPTLKGDIQVFRVDGNGAEYPLTCLKVEDTISKQFVTGQVS